MEGNKAAYVADIAKGFNEKVIFVDDMPEQLIRAKDMSPDVTVVRMRRKGTLHFDEDLNGPDIFEIASFDELDAIIEKI